MPGDLAGVIFLLLNVLTILIFARAIFSWFDPGFRSPIGRILFDITEPIIAPVRQVVPSMGMFDLSIMVTLLLLFILRQVLTAAIYG